MHFRYINTDGWKAKWLRYTNTNSMNKKAVYLY